MGPTILTSTSAEIQMSQSSPAERSKLIEFMGKELATLENTKRESNSNLYVTKWGSKRIAWRRAEGGQPIILAITERNYYNQQ